MGKAPTKKIASKAGKTLSNPKASKRSKLAAAKTLAASRDIKPAVKTGKLTRSIAKKAVKTVVSRRKRAS